MKNPDTPVNGILTSVYPGDLPVRRFPPRPSVFKFISFPRVSGMAPEINYTEIIHWVGPFNNYRAFATSREQIKWKIIHRAFWPCKCQEGEDFAVENRNVTCLHTSEMYNSPNTTAHSGHGR